MKPLRPLREDATQTDEAAAAGALLRGLPPGDPVSPFAKGRVWAKLRSRAERKPRRSFQIVAIALLLLASSAIAGGRLGFFGVTFLTPSGLTGTEGSGTHANSPTSSGSALPQASAPASAEASSEPEPALAEAPSAQATSPASSHTPAPKRAPVPSEVALPVPTASAESQVAARSMEEAELVLDGLRALRSEGNPAHATTLFSRYLSRHPGGALAEDAMGYRMEAADRTKSPDARAYANAYLKAYPGGRYVGLAKRLQDASVSPE